METCYFACRQHSFHYARAFLLFGMMYSIQIRVEFRSGDAQIGEFLYLTHSPVTLSASTTASRLPVVPELHLPSSMGIFGGWRFKTQFRRPRCVVPSMLSIPRAHHGVSLPWVEFSLLTLPTADVLDPQTVRPPRHSNFPHPPAKLPDILEKRPCKILDILWGLIGSASQVVITRFAMSPVSAKRALDSRTSCPTPSSSPVDWCCQDQTMYKNFVRPSTLGSDPILQCRSTCSFRKRIFFALS